MDPKPRLLRAINKTARDCNLHGCGASSRFKEVGSEGGFRTCKDYKGMWGDPLTLRV